MNPPVGAAREEAARKGDTAGGAAAAADQGPSKYPGDQTKSLGMNNE